MLLPDSTRKQDGPQSHISMRSKPSSFSLHRTRTGSSTFEQVFAPGIYKLDETIHVQRSCQAVCISLQHL